MIDFMGIFRALTRSKHRKQPTLEGLVHTPEVKIVNSEPEVFHGQSAVLDEILEPATIEQPQRRPYGTDFREDMGYPHWFYDSQNKLRQLGIKGENQTALAREYYPQSIEELYRNIRGRLQKILGIETESFIKNVPWVLMYKNNYLKSYIEKLQSVANLIHSIFVYDAPPQSDWRKSPTSFKDLESLSQLESKLRSLSIYVRESPEFLKLKENLEATGYIFEIVAAIVEKGFRVYSSYPFIGYNYGPFRHIRNNVYPAIKEQGMVHFAHTFRRMLSENSIIEPTAKTTSGGQFASVYSLNPSVDDITNPALRAYITQVLRKRQITR